MGFRLPSKPSLSYEAVGRDGASEGSSCKVDEVAASRREVKTEDCLYYFFVFAGIFPSMHPSESGSYGAFPSTVNRMRQ